MTYMEHEWDIFEFNKNTTPWDVVILGSIISFGIAAYFVFIGNFFGATLFIVLPVVLALVMRREPKNIKTRIDKKGVHINKNTHKFKDLAYFSITNGHLIVKPKERDAIYVPVHAKEEDTIRAALAYYEIKEDEHEESMTELANRMLHLK